MEKIGNMFQSTNQILYMLIYSRVQPGLKTKIQAKALFSNDFRKFS
jgi:hypothetical protein